MKRHISNLFTLLNLFFGCIAIVFALQNGIDVVYTKEGEQFIKLKENICLASLFIAIAAVVDFLDGFVARALNICSEMGKQLDSLADMASFGVAPGIILYQFLRMGYIKEADGIEAPILFLLPAFIFTCAGAYRLARFNIDTSQAYGFKGVPIPAAGLVVASLPLIYWYSNSDVVYNLILNKWFLYALTILLSWLMVSKLPIMAMKFKDYSLKNNMPKIILIAITVISAVLLKWLAVPVIFIAYIILSLALKNKTTT
ncbi:MAG: CDP-alcohol phosphatidyltransferase family protein [Ferruginibacter sp.]|jgi:CDP-diacylglycerol--serine O-phosphatidyltransferase